MSQDITRIKSEDKKALKKFIVYMVVSGIIGFGLGFGMVFVKFFGRETIDRILYNGAIMVIPYAIPVVALAILITVAIIYRKSRKAFREWDGESEEQLDKVEERLSFAVWLTSINNIWNYFVFGATFALKYWENLENQKGFGSALWMVAVFLIATFLVIIEQQWIVNLEKEMNPEKRGSIYDTKFREKWEESCDEAELWQIYKSAYKAYKATHNACIILWLFCVLGSFVWDFGVVPVLMITILWTVLVTGYCMEANRLSKKGGR